MLQESVRQKKGKYLAVVIQYLRREEGEQETAA